MGSWKFIELGNNDNNISLSFFAHRSLEMEFDILSFPTQNYDSTLLNEATQGISKAFNE